MLRTYLLREDAQPLVYPAPIALAGPPLHGVRTLPLLVPLVDPPLLPCCVAPKACAGPPVKTPVYDPRRLTGDKQQPPFWRAFFLRLAMRFRPASACHTPMCEYYGDLVGD